LPRSEKRQKIFCYFSLYFAFNFPFGQEANGKQIKENCLGFRFPFETGAYMSPPLLTQLEKLVPDFPLMSVMVIGSRFLLYIKTKDGAVLCHDVYLRAGWLLIWGLKYLEYISSIRTENNSE
jgi:hypothetical protein